MVNRPPQAAYDSCYLKRGDIATIVDGMPARVGRVRGRALGDRHGEKEGLLAVWVLSRIVLHHPGEKILRASNGDTFHTTRTNINAAPRVIGERTVVSYPPPSATR